RGRRLLGGSEGQSGAWGDGFTRSRVRSPSAPRSPPAVARPFEIVAPDIAPGDHERHQDHAGGNGPWSPRQTSAGPRPTAIAEVRRPAARSPSTRTRTSAPEASAAGSEARRTRAPRPRRAGSGSPRAPSAHG